MKNNNFDGERYFHPWPELAKNLLTVLKWQWTSKKKPWPKQIQNKSAPEFAKNLKAQDIEITFINHATVYFRHAGLSFITDPHWGLRASPITFAGPKRVRAAGAKIEGLPALDYVLVSHNHYDHLDIPSLKKLNSIYNPKFLIPKGDAKLMTEAGILNFIELDWWDEVDLPNDCKIIFVPVKHWSARNLSDRNKSLWGGFIIQSPDKNIFFAGDTGYCDIFKTLSDKYGFFDVALLPIGAYEPRWFMKDAHMNPQEAVQAHQDLKSKFSMAIHFGLWQLTDEAMEQPAIDLELSLKQSQIPAEKFFIPDVGQTVLINK